MKNATLGATAVVSVIALLLSLSTLYHIRFKKCQDAYDQCVRECDATRDRVLGENQLRRNQINFQLLLDLRDCRINNVGNQAAIDQCQTQKTNEAAQELAQLDAADDVARQSDQQCRRDCLDEAKKCDASFGPHGPIVTTGPNVPAKIDCLEGGAPCFKKVLEICTKISGPCDECWKSLCGGGDWSFESSVPLEVTLVAATDPLKDVRVLATSSAKGKQAVLSVPTDIKLNKREQLYFGFSSKEKPGGPVDVIVRQGK